MKDLLIDVLERFCPNNVFLQGTLDENAKYPETFITFWTYDVPEGSHYDDEAHSFDWSFLVNIYSSDQKKLNTMPEQIRQALKGAGFIPQGKGNDLPSDVPTHTAWTMDVLYRETINN